MATETTTVYRLVVNHEVRSLYDTVSFKRGDVVDSHRYTKYEEGFPADVIKELYQKGYISVMEGYNVWNEIKFPSSFTIIKETKVVTTEVTQVEQDWNALAKELNVPNYIPFVTDGN